MKTLLLIIATLCFFTTGCAQIANSPKNSRKGHIEDEINTYASGIDMGTIYSKEDIYTNVERVLNIPGDIYGASWTVIPADSTPESTYYVYKDGSTLVRIEGLDYGGIDKKTQNTFRSNLRAGKMLWSNAYQREDVGGVKKTVETLFKPVLDANGNLRYVITADLLVDDELETK